VSNSKVWSTLSTPLKKRRKIIEANINYCFDDKPEEWRQALINKTWDETLLGLYDNNLAWNAGQRINNIKCEIKNEALLREAQHKGEGVLMLFRHNVFLEMSARLISENFDIYGMERPNNSQVMQKVIKSGRLKAVKGLASNKNVNETVEWLKKGRTVLYGPDQDYRNKRSVVSTFFGKDCLTTTVPYTLKKLTKCKLFYLDFYRAGNGFKFSIEDIGHLADSPQSFADEINKKIENDVLANPEQYFWHHRRFKSQNPKIYD
jgi:KDO2-lipid IV(A) lauroyltransferase